MPKKTHYIKTFYVRGNGSFPVDMLRYDSAWPDDSSDARNIELSRDEVGRDDWLKPRSIKLNTAVENDAQSPTPARWESFGWKCSDKPFSGDLVRGAIDHPAFKIGR